MADKSTELIATALSRAAVEPDGTPLFAAKAEEGLFPATTTARPIAQRCLDEGLLRIVRTEYRGRAEREIATITEKGLLQLVRESDPRQVLEDFLRALELRHGQAEELTRAVEGIGRSLATMREAITQLLPRLSHPVPMNGHVVMNGSCLSSGSNSDIPTRVMSLLQDWHRSAGASEDCPLPELYRRLTHVVQGPTVGEFHDGLRQLQEDGQVCLHPWTAPLYEMPEPRFALLVGHEIAYYANVRSAMNHGS